MYQDAVTVAPQIHQVIFENDVVRILKVQLRPGDYAEMHSHPENVNYILQGGLVRFSSPDGTSSEVLLETGKTIHSTGTIHSVESLVDTVFETIQIEFK